MLMCSDPTKPQNHLNVMLSEAKHLKFDMSQIDKDSSVVTLLLNNGRF